jgi:hypothetical protein
MKTFPRLGYHVAFHSRGYFADFCAGKKYSLVSRRSLDFDPDTPHVMRTENHDASWGSVGQISEFVEGGKS